MISLAQHIRSKRAKHYILMSCLVLIVSYGFAQTGVINKGAKMVVNTGAVMKITGSGADYTNEDTLGFNGRIDLDGKIILEGDWTNNTTSDVFINANTDGLVLFNGSSQQNILGSTASLFENVELDNTSGLSLSVNMGIKNDFKFTNGSVLLNTKDVFIGTNGTISGTFGATKMFVVNNTGTLKKRIGGIGSFVFPIGEITGTTEFTPVSFNLASHSGVSGTAWVSAHVTNIKHPSNTSPSEFLNRYWTLSSSGITSPNYSANYYYQQADVSGIENIIYSAEYDGANRTVYSTVDATNNKLSFTGMSTFADYTGVDGTIPTVSVTSSEDPGPTNVGPVPFTVTFSEEVTGFDHTDITVDNGTASTVSTTDDISFDFTVTPDKDSTVTIDIASAVAQDIAGNDNSAASTYRIVYDSTNPTVTISGSTLPQNTAFDVTIEFNEEVTGFASEDIAVTNGDVTFFNAITAGYEYVATITPSVTDDMVYVDISAGVAADLAGNTNESATQYSVQYDEIAPGVTLSGPASPTNQIPFTLTIEFDESVVDFDLSDLSKTNCNIAGWTEVTEGILYTVSVTPTVTNGTVTVDLAAGKVHDDAGNANGNVTDYTVTYDGVSPGVDITTAAADPTNISPFGITIIFDEEVNHFHLEDISVTNGSASNFSTSDSTGFTADITPTGSGLVTIDVLAGVAFDNAGNNNTAGQLSITYDEDDPLLSSTYPVDNATDVALTDNLQMTFDEVVNEGSGSISIRHTSDDSEFQAINVSALSGYGTKTITINLNDFTSQIEYYVTVPSGAFVDEAGNPYVGISSTTAWSFTIVDENVPVISTVSPADETENVGVSANLVITFNESVNAVAGKYIHIVNETTSAVESIESINTGLVNVSNEVVTINPTDFDGETTYHVLIDAGAFEDGETNLFGGISSTSYWNFTTEDITSPTISEFVPSNGATGVAIDAALQITFDENVSAGAGSVTIRDVVTSSSHYTIGATSLTMNNNIVNIDPTDFDGETEYYVEIDADAFKDASGNYYTGISGSGNWNFTTVDNTAPTVSVVSSVSSPTNNSPFEITITFNEAMTGFGLGGISVQNGSPSNLQTSDDMLFTTDIVPDAEGKVIIIIPDGVATDAAGNGNEESNELTIEYDNTSPTVSITSTEPNPTASSFDITMSFSEGITELISEDFTIGNGSVSNISGSLNGASWDATITPTTDGTVTVEILAGEVADTAGNINTASNQFNIEYDATGPEVVALDPTNGEDPVPFNTDLQITFNENVNLNATYYVHIYESGFGLVESFEANTLSGDGTNTITINPSDFESEKTYYVEIDAQAFTDDLGNGYLGMSSGEWEFTIEDITKPTVANLDPGNGTQDVAVNATFEITFSEEVDKNVGSIIIINDDEYVEHETIDVETGPVTVVGNVATFDPVNTFIGETNYYILVGESTFQDVSPNQNNFAGITSSSAWTFKTIDSEPPVISTKSPMDNSIDVVLNTNLVATFNEDISMGSGGNITLMDDQGVVEVMDVGSDNITISGNQLIINPTYDLQGLTNYYVLIDNTAIEDLFNNSFAGISNADTWNFTTVDASAPAVTNLSPADNDNGVNADANLIMTFDKTVVKTTGTITIMNSTESTIHEEIDVTTSQVDVNGNVVTIEPSFNFTDFDDYYVLIDNGAIQDLDGNSYPGISDPTLWNFTAGDYTKPTIVNLTPANDAENVSLTANLEIIFSENILPGSGSIVIKNSTTGSALTTFDVSAVDITANVATMNPGPDFEEKTSYHVLIDGGAFVDESGNEFAGIADNSTWSFTTGDFTNPEIVELSPENNASNVAIGTDLYAIFSEEVVANTGLINIMSGTATAESIDVLSDQVEINADTVFIKPGFSMNGETSYHVLIDNNAFHDMAGNSFAGITEESIWQFNTEDITQPTVTLTSSESGTVNDDFVVTITFSEEVTGFEISDIDVTNAELSDFTNITNAKVWTVVVSPFENGDVYIDIAAGVAQDAAGNPNTAASQFSIIYDSGVGIEDVIPFDINIYSTGNKVIIEFLNTDNYKLEEGKVEIYNLVGQKIVEENLYDLDRFETEVEHVSHIYVVKVTLNDSEYQKRVFVE